MIEGPIGWWYVTKQDTGMSSTTFVDCPVSDYESTTTTNVPMITVQPNS